MGKYVGVLLGNRVHRHRSCDENAGLWIQGVYVHYSAFESINAVWTCVMITSSPIDHV